MDLQPRQVALIKYLTVMAGWGTIGVFVVEAQTSPFNIVFFRCAIGAVFLAGLCMLRGHLKQAHWTKKNLWLILGGGATLVSNWTLLFFGLQMSSISISMVVYHMQPFFVLLIGVIVLREGVSLVKTSWVLLAFVGLVLTTELETLLFGSSMSTEHLLGIACALGAALLYAIATVSGRQVTGIRPEVIALLQCALGSLLLLPLAPIGDIEWGTGRWGWLVVMGVVHTGILYTFYYAALPKLPATSIAVLAFVYPAVAILTDVVFYGQRLDVFQILGILLIFGSSLGVTLNWGERKAKIEEPVADAVPVEVSPVPPRP